MGLGVSSGKTIVAAVSTRSLVLWDVQGNFLSQHPFGGRSVVVAEATGDEHEDVLVATRNGSIILLDGRTMQLSVILQSNERAFATRIDVADCDGDGRPDVLISSPQMASGGYQRGAASVYVASSAGINWQKPTWHAEGDSKLLLGICFTKPPCASNLNLTQAFKIRSGSGAASRVMPGTSSLVHRVGERAATRVLREWV
jgi:hypothetical protein